MLNTISITVIAFMLIVLAAVLISIFVQMRRSVQRIQSDIHTLSLEINQLLTSIHHFVRNDLHAVTEQTTHLISNLNSLSSTTLDPHSNTVSFNSEAIPQVMKWVARSVFVFKTIREVIKKHETRT